MITKITYVENQIKDSFKILNGMPRYIAIEEKENTNFGHVIWKDYISTIIDFAIQHKLNRISALINRSSNHYLNLVNILVSFGFEKYASKVELFRELKDINNNVKNYEWHSLSNSTISDEEFKKLWKNCMSGSENAPSSLTMDEHLNSVKNEIGEKWRDSCNAIYLEGKPIGVSIPHIETGTEDEGRLFYFGILPEERGKGHSALIHYQSMYLLKQMGATYYIGSTHDTNKRMQKVFIRNGCSIKAKTESYYKYI